MSQPPWKAYFNDRKIEDKIQFQSQYGRAVAHRTSVKDYKFIKPLGEGAFGKVLLAYNQNKQPVKYVAIKILQKENVKDQAKYTIEERNLLASVSFAFLVGYEDSFQDFKNLYICIEFISGGELFMILMNKGKFDEKVARFFSAQIVLMFEYLQSVGVIFRDLKPENIMVTADGYLKLVDFGLAKILKGRTWTICGTPEYMAPELIQNKGYGFAADWWAVGIIIYELNFGSTPFVDDNPMKIYEGITAGQYDMPSEFSAPLRDLVNNMLQTDPTKRFGNLRFGVDDIKGHQWFNDLDWIRLVEQKITATFTPKIKAIREPKKPLDATGYGIPSDKEKAINKFGDTFKDF